jgi:reversibly glycosylated polypeptide/UDP-arabinopyranose mutase
MKAIIVIPTIRDLTFLEDWRGEFTPHKIIVCEDHPEKQIDLPRGFQIDHYCWKDIDAELGDASWIIPHFNASIRSFGYWKAWQEQPDLIVTIDDDCYPPAHEGGPGFIQGHWQNVQRKVTFGWEKTAPFFTRGFPYEVRDTARTVVSHGLWAGIPDLDAPTQLLMPQLTLAGSPGVTIMPRGTYFPMSGMNLAFTPEIAPAMYFLLQGRDWPFDRFDDIWAGVLVKKICDHLGLAMASGEPLVEHRRASNVYSNLKKEAAGIEANEYFWRNVDAIHLESDNVRDCYKELARKLTLQGEYWDKLRAAMLIWAELFADSRSTYVSNGSSPSHAEAPAEALASGS